MTVSLVLHPAEKPRNRSIEARRAARRARFERERLIVNSLNRGVSVVEIAERIGVTEKRMRALVKDILARRMAAAPEDYAALQASRLNEALLVAYGAMSDKNLKAVALVVRIVRELDRYHGFAAADARAHLPHGVGKSLPPREDPGVSGDPRTVIRGASAAAPAIRPEMAPQALEMTESAAESVALPNAFDAAPLETENARSVQADNGGGKRRTTPRRRPPTAAIRPGVRRAPRRRGNGAASG